MTNSWSFLWTPQFWFATLAVGFLLNVLGNYAVRLLDRVGARLSGYFRQLLGEEAARTETLTAAAASDNALWAALAAEASRLRLHQLLRFLTAFVFSCVGILLTYALGEVTPPSSNTPARLVAVGSLVFGFIQYTRGLDFGKRARRLDIALSAVHRHRKLPIMD